MEVEEITVHSYSNEARGATTPTVNAGVNDAGLVGDTVQLNGTASDYDSLVWNAHDIYQFRVEFGKNSRRENIKI